MLYAFITANIYIHCVNWQRCEVEVTLKAFAINAPLGQVDIRVSLGINMMHYHWLCYWITYHYLGLTLQLSLYDLSSFVCENYALKYSIHYERYPNVHGQNSIRDTWQFWLTSIVYLFRPRFKYNDYLSFLNICMRIYLFFITILIINNVFPLYRAIRNILHIVFILTYITNFLIKCILSL